jgi:hypothetical protein
VISHHVQEGFLPYKITSTVKGVTVSPRRVLLGDEAHRPGQTARGLRVTRLVAGPHHNADFANVGGKGLLNQNAQNGFFRAVVDESLEWKSPLIPPRCRDYRLPDPHVCRSSLSCDVARPSWP